MARIVSCKKLSKKFFILTVLSFLCLSKQSFSNQPIEVTANIENSGSGFFSFPQSVAGNGDFSNFGKEPFDTTTTNNNSITVSSGILVSGDVYGTKLSLDSQNDTPQLDLYITGNSANICKSANVNGNVYGGFASVNLLNYQHDIILLSVQNNTVNLLGHTEHATGGHSGLTGVSNTSGNIFNLTASTNEINASAYTINLRGGSSRISTQNNVLDATFNITALNNNVTSNSSDYCYGGHVYVDAPLSSTCVFNLEASNNKNNSYGNAKFIYGGYIEAVSQYSNNSNFNISASNNLINISGKVSYICYGGYINVYANHSLNAGLTLSATGNTIILSETAEISKDCVIYGGFCDWTTNPNPAGDLEIDVFSGNTLEAHRINITTYGLNNFENYIFYLPANIKNGDIIIKALNGTGGAKLGVGASNNSINLTNVNIILKSMPTLTMAPRDKVILIRSGLGFEGSPKSIGNEAVTVDGLIFSGKGKFNIYMLGNDLAALLESKEVTIKPETKSYSEGKAACTAFLNQGSEFIANKFIKEFSGISASAIIPYGAVSLGESKYTTGSHVNVSGLSLAVGIGRKFERTIFGIFCEAGNGTYKTCNDFPGYKTIAAKGNNEYKGVGTLLRVDLAKIYIESSARIGSTKANYESDDIKDFFNNSPKYNYDALYGGLHLGCGYVYKCFDGYLKYMFTYQEAQNIVLPTNETITFDAVISQKLRVGLKCFLSSNVKTKPYLGISYEQEFDGLIKANASNMPIENARLTGNNGICEMGISFNLGNFRFDLNGEGFVGKREGFAGNFKLKYIFGLDS
jgi:hypothetical protein